MIEVKWAFSLSKRCYGMGLISTKLEETQLTAIALSVFNRGGDYSGWPP